jgi:hypothetical protein
LTLRDFAMAKNRQAIKKLAMMEILPPAMGAL